MSKVLQIVLENESSSYRPSQIITGRVECFFTSKESFRALKIRFNGNAKTKWSESEEITEEIEIEIEHKDKEIYFKTEQVLVEGGNDFELPAGDYKYPFSFTLPPELPTSFQGKYGSIQYIIKALIDRPWAFDDETQVVLNVTSPLNLNYSPYLKEPVGNSINSTPGSCWCQSSGPITFKMSLPVTGFVPGQKVNIDAHIVNLSNIIVRSVTFQIVGEYEYILHDPGRIKYEEKLLVEAIASGVQEQGDKSWTTTLIVPEDGSYPNLLACGIINLKYFLKAELNLPFPHSNLHDKIKIVIGSIPLIGTDTSLSGSPHLQEHITYHPTTVEVKSAVDTLNGRVNISSHSSREKNSAEGGPYPAGGARYPSAYPSEALGWPLSISEPIQQT